MVAAAYQNPGMVPTCPGHLRRRPPRGTYAVRLGGHYALRGQHQGAQSQDLAEAFVYNLREPQGCLSLGVNMPLSNKRRRLEAIRN